MPTFLYPLVCLAIWLSASPLFAQDHEGFAFRQTLARWNAQISALEGGDANQRFQEASYLYFELKDREAKLRDLQFRGMGHNSGILDYVAQDALPRLNRLFERWNRTPDRAHYDRELDKQRYYISETEARIRNLWTEMQRGNPGILRVMQLMAFSRSETIGDGTIGDWNPNSPGNIQSTAIKGLIKVLNQIQNKGDRGISVSQLQEFQGTLIGAAEHHFSRGGLINGIVFRQGDGNTKHVREYLAEFEREINAMPPGLIASFEGYTRFIHLHPFGDVNGRIAEVIKQDILGRAGLPPTITREKISSENYLYQNIFGRGNYFGEVNDMARETEAFLNVWKQILGTDGKIIDVWLSGPHVVTTMIKNGRRMTVINNRTYSLAEGVELPPIKNSPVLIGRDAQDLSLRFTTDNWVNQNEVKPTHTVKTGRFGEVQLSYPFFVLDTPEISEQGTKMEFAFNYQTPKGETVWFKNRDQNFSAIVGQANATLCGVLKGAM